LRHAGKAFVDKGKDAAIKVREEEVEDEIENLRKDKSKR
jgi:hypothetical protein